MNERVRTKRENEYALRGADVCLRAYVSVYPREVVSILRCALLLLLCYDVRYARWIFYILYRHDTRKSIVFAVMPSRPKRQRREKNGRFEFDFVFIELVVSLLAHVEFESENYTHPLLNINFAYSTARNMISNFDVCPCEFVFFIIIISVFSDFWPVCGNAMPRSMFNCLVVVVVIVVPSKSVKVDETANTTTVVGMAHGTTFMQVDMYSPKSINKIQFQSKEWKQKKKNL